MIRTDNTASERLLLRKRKKGPEFPFEAMIVVCSVKFLIKFCSYFSNLGARPQILVRVQVD